MTASNQYGYVEFDGVGMSEEILASSHDLEKISITIDPGATDPSNANGTEILRRGLLMYVPAGADYYKELDVVPPTPAEIETIIVLGAEVVMNAGGAAANETAVAMAYFTATFKKEKIFDSTGFQTNTHWADLKIGATVVGSGALVSRLRERTNI